MDTTYISVWYHFFVVSMTTFTTTTAQCHFHFFFLLTTTRRITLWEQSPFCTRYPGTFYHPPMPWGSCVTAPGPWTLVVLWAVLCLSGPWMGGVVMPSSNWEHLAGVPRLLNSTRPHTRPVVVDHRFSLLLRSLLLQCCYWPPRLATRLSYLLVAVFCFTLTTCTSRYFTHPCTHTHHWHWLPHLIAVFIV